MNQQETTPEDSLFILLGRWLRLHHRWQTRLPALAAILHLPSAAPDADQAIHRQNAEAVVEIGRIRAEAEEWSATLDEKLPALPPGCGEFAEAFRLCLAAYEPWIARVASPGALAPAALAEPLREAEALTQNLNSSVRLRLYELHPLPAGDGGFSIACIVGGVVLGLVLGSVVIFLIALALGMVVACLSDWHPRRRSALSRQRRLERLIETE